MTDSISTDDVARADRNVDPTALNRRDIQESMPDDFSRSAKREFARRVSQQREGVSRQAQRELRDNLSEPGANGRRQLFGQDVDSGRTTFVGTSERVEPEVQDDGTVIGRNTDTGTAAVVGEIDLDAGAPEGGRSDEW